MVLSAGGEQVHEHEEFDPEGAVGTADDSSDAEPSTPRARSTMAGSASTRISHAKTTGPSAGPSTVRSSETPSTRNTSPSPKTLAAKRSSTGVSSAPSAAVNVGKQAATSAAPRAGASAMKGATSVKGKTSPAGAAASVAASKVIKTKPEEEGTGKGAAKEALRDAASGAVEGAVTKGGVPGAVLGALKGLSGTFKNNKVFRNAVLMILAVSVGALPMAAAVGVVLLSSMSAGGTDQGVESSKINSVQSSGLEGNSIGSATHALQLTGSDVPWTIVLAANELIGNDEEKQKEEIKKLEERGPVEVSDEAAGESPEEPTAPPEDVDDEATAVSSMVQSAADHYSSTKSEKDKQSERDTKQVYGWDLYSFSRIVSGADPNRKYSNVAAGAVTARAQENRARSIYDPEDGGNQALWNTHLATKALYVSSLEEAGVSNSDAEKIFDQALEWELGTIGCASDTVPASNGNQEGNSSGSGSWLTPGTDQYKVAKEIFDILTEEYGVSGAFAAGVIGNVEQESGFNVEVTNSIGAKGLFQFLPASKAEPWMEGGSWSVKNQVAAVWGLEFQNRAVWRYVQQNAPGTFDSLEDWLSTDDPVAASKAFLLGYERPGAHEAMAEKREANAKAADEVFNKDRIKADKTKWKLDGNGGSGGDTSNQSSGSQPECDDQLASSTWLTDGSCNPKNDATGWFWPSDQFVVTQGYHDGYALDMGSAPGGAKCAPYDGVVVYSGDNTPLSGWFAGCPAPWHGNNVVVVVEHKYKGQTIYSAHSHLKKGSTAPVGARVKAGQQVASAGMSGCTTGPHAHFALSSGRTGWPQNIDPYQYIPRP